MKTLSTDRETLTDAMFHKMTVGDSRGAILNTISTAGLEKALGLDPDDETRRAIQVMLRSRGVATTSATGRVHTADDEGCSCGNFSGPGSDCLGRERI